MSNQLKLPFCFTYIKQCTSRKRRRRSKHTVAQIPGLVYLRQYRVCDFVFAVCRKEEVKIIAPVNVFAVYFHSAEHITALYFNIGFPVKSAKNAVRPAAPVSSAMAIRSCHSPFPVHH